MKFLRKVRRGVWAKHPTADWPEDSGLSSDALDDMRTTKGSMSVYAIMDVADRKRIAVALAATRNDISHLDYVIFESLESLGIAVRQTEGDTPDKDVNELHYNLGNLTVKRLAQLTEIVSDGEHERIKRPDIKTALYEATRVGRLDMSQIKPSMREHLS